MDTQRVKEVFAGALELRGSDRGAFLDSACGADEALRAEVQSLLSAAESNGDALLGAPSAEDGLPSLAVPLREGPGTTIGNYRLVRQIGEGGFGVVFLAEQERPVRRQVALKVIKLGMDTRQVVARFEVERQALAMMDHPNIAKVLDAGATESGRAFFVTELVSGVPVTVFCDREGLNVRRRLELFLLVCGAVAHAHQRGIIHRDIKPGNVLVERIDGMPSPKVIDFGVARSTRASLLGATILTEARQIIGTLEYMSPEQADPAGARGVDTRGDVYSLGALLYELLAGAPPIDRSSLGEDVGYVDLLRTVLEVDPQPPSVRRRHVHPEWVAVPQELDWVVMKCLEKDRERRYPSVTALADDVGRFLRDEPVQAGPSTPGYRLRKFVARHRTAVGAGVLVTLAVAAAIVGTTAGLLRARAARAQAEQNLKKAQAEAARAGAVTTFLGDVFSLAESGVGSGGEDASARDVLQRASGRIDATFAGRPRERVVARRLLAHGCERMFLYDLAAEELRKGVDTASDAAARIDAARRLDLRADWALAMYLARRGTEAAPAAAAVLDECRRTLGERHPVTWEAMQACALCISETGDTAGAYALLKRLVEITRNEPAAYRASRLGRYLCNGSAALRDHGEPDAAADALREAAPILLTDLVDHDDSGSPGPLAAAATTKATALDAEPWPLAERAFDQVEGGGWIAREMVEGGVPEALPLIEKYVEQALRRHPQGTPTISYRLEDVANLRLRQGDLPGAASSLARAIEVSPKPRGGEGGADITRWRLAAIRCSPRLARGWRSEALRAQVWCALDDLLRDHPPMRLALDEVSVEALRFKLLRWNYVSDSAEPVAEGGLTQLQAADQPPAGTYLLGVEVPRLGAEPLRRANWLLFQPWKMTFRAVSRFDGVRTANSSMDHDWRGVAGAAPFSVRESFGLAMQEALLGPADLGRVQWFTADAVTQAELPAGRYRLSATSDDGVRVSVDGNRVIDWWRPRASGTSDAEVQLSAGPHELHVEFFQETGGYTLRLQLAPLTAAARSAAEAVGGGVPGAEFWATWHAQLRKDQPLRWEFKREQGRWLAAAGRFREAAEAYAAAVEQHATDPWLWQARATLAAWLDADGEQYRRVARGFFDRFRDTPDPDLMARLLLCCCLRTELPVPEPSVGELLSRASDLADVPAPLRPVFKLAEGAAHVRLRQFDAATLALSEAMQSFPPEACDFRLAAASLLAIAADARGAREEAAAARAVGERIFRLESRRPGVDDLDLVGFDNWLIGRIAWREADPVPPYGQPKKHVPS